MMQSFQHSTAFFETEQTPESSFEVSVKNLMEALEHTVWRHRKEKAGLWEPCYCALALLLNPLCRTYEVMETLPTDGMPMDIHASLNAISNLGFFIRQIDAMPEGIEPRLLPCLFTASKSNEPLVIIKSTDAGIYVYDGRKKGVRLIRKGDKEGRVSGTAWLFSPFDYHRQETSRFMRAGTGYSWFRALVGRFSKTFVYVFLSGIALNIVALASPLYMMAVYDMILSPADRTVLAGMAIGVTIAIITEYALRATRSKALSWLSARLDTIVGTKIFAHLIGLPCDLVERASVAAQIARIKTFESVRDLFSGSVFLSFLEIPYVILAIALIGWIAGELVVVPLLVLGAYMLLFALMRRKIKVVIRLAAKASSGRQQFAIEAFEKMSGIRANGLEKIWARKFNDLVSQEIVMNFHLSWLGTVAETLAHALTLMSAILTIGLGAHLVWTGQMTTGALIASMMLVWRVLTPFYSLCSMIPRLEQLRNSILQVNDLMVLDTEAEAARTAARLPVLQGRVSFSGVDFCYEEKGDHLFGTLDFDIKPGSMVAVMGRNGSGKTSLLKLVKGLYRPQKGSVRIDGFDIRQLDPVYLRRQIAYVPQNPEFFSLPLIDNLRITHPLATDHEVEISLRLADAWEEVQKMPNGVNTVLLPDKIPEGLAARLSLARAYLHSGPVLLIDELPGVLVNSAAGQNLRRYIEKSRGKRTIIMITHRDEILEMADMIVELRRGETPRYVGKPQIMDRTKEIA